jgi:hypothetical protein
MGKGVKKGQHIFIALAAVMIWCSAALPQDYTATEISFIEWGEGPGQLKITGPETEYNPNDSSDYVTWPGIGPSGGFVDKNENFYFVISEFDQFKGFRRDGSLLLDYSVGAPDYNPEFFRAGVGEYYVDSLCRIYINGSFDYDYVAMVDTLGNLLAKLSPYGAGSGNRMVSLDRGSDDALLFRVRHGGQTMLYTYRNQQFIGGGCEWLAVDGNCYWVRKIGSSTIEFKKYGDRDSVGEVGWEEIVTQQYPLEMIDLGLMGIDDNMKLYLCIVFPETDEARVAVYDTLFQLDTEFVLPSSPNRYDWAMSPFMRHDGNVYEFRCLDDGMHIYRWVRE